jgi:hypothetical protein
MAELFDGDFERDAARLSERLDGFAGDPDGLRDAFLARHVHALYAQLTDDGTDGLRADDFCYAAAERVPGLAPTRAQVQRERERFQKDKEGYEIAQGQLLGHVLANPETGRHLIDVMLRPTQLALDHQTHYEATGHADLGAATATRRGNVGTVELRNPRSLNTEDDTTTGPLEAAIDLVLLDPQVHAPGAQRGDHPRRREPAAAPLRRRPPRAPGDPLRPRARARGARRRHPRARGDGRGDRAHRGPPGQRRRGVWRRQSQSAPHRSGAAGHLPRVHGDILPRAGRLPLQLRADRQLRGELARP